MKEWKRGYGTTAYPRMGSHDVEGRIAKCSSLSLPSRGGTSRRRGETNRDSDRVTKHSKLANKHRQNGYLQGRVVTPESFNEVQHGQPVPTQTGKRKDVGNWTNGRFRFRNHLQIRGNHARCAWSLLVYLSVST
jgi:hypothetical protein